MKRGVIICSLLLITGCATTNIPIKKIYITQEVNPQKYFTDERKNWVGEFVVFHFYTGYVEREVGGIISGVFEDSEGEIRWEFTPTRPFYFIDTLQRGNLILSVVPDPYLGWIDAKVTKVYIKNNEIDHYLIFPRKKHPDWPEEIWDLIKKGKIRLGMTKEQVRLSWGQPNDINRSVGPWGIHEQWVYGSQYLYFENGILTSWQD